MDNSFKDVEEKDYIDILKNAQDKVSKIVIPSMGLLDKKETIYIDGKEVFKKKDDKECKLC